MLPRLTPSNLAKMEKAIINEFKVLARSRKRATSTAAQLATFNSKLIYSTTIGDHPAKTIAEPDQGIKPPETTAPMPQPRGRDAEGGPAHGRCLHGCCRGREHRYLPDLAAHDAAGEQAEGGQ